MRTAALFAIRLSAPLVSEHTYLPLASDLKAIELLRGTRVKVSQGPIASLLAIKG